MADITAAGTTSYPSSVDSRSAITDGVTQRLAAQINGPAAAILAIESELGTAPRGTAADVKTRLAVALNDDGTVKSSVIAGPQVSYSGGVFTVSSSLAGQCYLSRTDNTNLKLSRYNGTYLLINNVSQQIPAVGVTLTNSGLSANTVYYIYAYMNSTTMTLEASATGHATDSTSGIEVKSGDATRTLVGMIKTGSGSEFADSTTQRFVCNYYNRHVRDVTNYYTTSRTTMSTSYVEPSSEIRAEFLTWADEAVSITWSGIISMDTVSERGQVSIGIDGTTAENAFTGCQTGFSVNFYPASVSMVRMMTEGYHYATVLAKVTNAAATLTLSGIANTSGNRPTLTARVQG